MAILVILTRWQPTRCIQANRHIRRTIPCRLDPRRLIILLTSPILLLIGMALNLAMIISYLALLITRGMKTLLIMFLPTTPCNMTTCNLRNILTSTIVSVLNIAINLKQLLRPKIQLLFKPNLPMTMNQKKIFDSRKEQSILPLFF